MNKFDELKDKAKDAAREHSGEAEQKIDEAGDKVDEATGGKASGAVDKGQEAAKGATDDLLGGDEQQQ